MVEFVKRTILGYIKAGGSLVDDVEFERRKEICEGCESVGLVWIPGGEVRGCLECGCPLDTKLRAKRYFSMGEMEMVESRCPVGKW